MLRANADGRRHARRRARGDRPQSFQTNARLNGTEAASSACSSRPARTPHDTSRLIRERLEELSAGFPDGVAYDVPYDTAPFVSISIGKVVSTFFEAMALVFAVMLLFLQSLRYTFIPAIVAPIAILGTFGVMLALGFSINVLTMFGMVLAIGIVDDAIVGSRTLSASCRMSGYAQEATKKATREITERSSASRRPLRRVPPHALASGSVGSIYRQFTLYGCHRLLGVPRALSFARACFTPYAARGESRRKKGFFGWFNRGFSWFTDR